MFATLLLLAQSVDAIRRKPPQHQLVTRAVAVFVDNEPHFVLQTRALYASWIAVRVERLPIDLLLFISDAETQFGDDLECTRDYHGHNDRNDCYIVLIDNESAQRQATADARARYGFLKSVDFLYCDEAHFLLKYDYVLKTDCDTFLTPAFARFTPSLFQVGRAGYAGQYDTQQLLAEWATRLGYRHYGVHNLGASWFGESALVVEAAQLATEITVRLLDEAFKPEAVSNQGWPRWWKGVASLYGQELAINALIPEAEVNEQMDFPSNEPGKVQHVHHIHCWHTDHLFSKFAFADGWYDWYNISGWDTSDVRVWSLSMALRAKGKVPFGATIATYPYPIGNVNVNYGAHERKPGARPPGSPTPQPTTRRKVSVSTHTLAPSPRRHVNSTAGAVHHHNFTQLLARLDGAHLRHTLPPISATTTAESQ